MACDAAEGGTPCVTVPHTGGLAQGRSDAGGTPTPGEGYAHAGDHPASRNDSGLSNKRRSAEGADGCRAAAAAAACKPSDGGAAAAGAGTAGGPLPKPRAGRAAGLKPKAATPASTRAQELALKDLCMVYPWGKAQGFRIYVSGQIGAGSAGALREKGITRVVNCCDRVVCPFADELKAYYVCKGFFDIKSTVLANHIPPVLRLLDEAESAGEGVLVHCMSGASRSTSCVIGWLMSRKGVPYDQALSGVKAGRPITSPNLAFRSQLQAHAIETPPAPADAERPRHAFLRKGEGKRGSVASAGRVKK